MSRWRSCNGHGGLFKTKGVGQRLLAGALGVPVAVMETAGEGGPWGMALLAAYRKNHQEGESLADYLEQKVFAGASWGFVWSLCRKTRQDLEHTFSVTVLDWLWKRQPEKHSSNMGRAGSSRPLFLAERRGLRYNGNHRLQRRRIFP